MERVIVVGNGLSIAGSRDFRVGNLTKLVREELDHTKIGNRTLLQILELAGKHLVPDQAAYEPERNFEHLLGPLDRLADLFSGPLLAVLSDVVDDTQLAVRVGSSARDLYTRAVATVLRAIDSIGVDHEAIKQSVDWFLADIRPADTASIFTLNYDALLDGWIIDASKRPNCSWSFDDEFAPFYQATLTVGDKKVPMIPMRPRTTIRPRKVHLYHLHGALHWVAEDHGADVVVFKARDIDDLRAVHLFDVWADGEVRPARPHVLLTDQKLRRVTVEPFAAAYEALAQSLRRADRVLVAGYGFGDKPLNLALAEGHANRQSNAQWLISRRGIKGQKFLDRWRAEGEIARNLQCSRKELSVSFAGLPSIAKEQADFWKPT